jgi:hypothetical protein
LRTDCQVWSRYVKLCELLILNLLGKEASAFHEEVHLSRLGKPFMHFMERL